MQLDKHILNQYANPSARLSRSGAPTGAVYKPYLGKSRKTPSVYIEVANQVGINNRYVSLECPHAKLFIVKF